MKADVFAQVHADMEKTNFLKISKREQKKHLDGWLANALDAAVADGHLNDWEKESFCQAVLDLEAGLFFASKHQLYCATMPAAPHVIFSEEMRHLLAKLTPEKLKAEAERIRHTEARDIPVFRWAAPE